MILTHPWLFNAIVIFFIAFTSGWLVFVLTGRRSIRLRKRINKLEAEKEALHQRIQLMDEETKDHNPQASNRNTPVIPLTAHRANKTNG